MPVCYAKKLKLMISYETSLCIDLNITNTMFYAIIENANYKLMSFTSITYRRLK